VVNPAGRPAEPVHFVIDGRYPTSPLGREAMTDKPKRLEAANFERAEAAIEWEVAENKADETGRPVDKVEAEARDRALDAADRKIRQVKADP
jgi:hypothetical protein